ncbi:hypothetical protein JCM10450v2_004806 [Rhodotorula kratochvilovae]
MSIAGKRFIPQDIICLIVQCAVPPPSVKVGANRKRADALRHLAGVSRGWHAAARDAAVSALFLDLGRKHPVWADEPQATGRLGEMVRTAGESGRSIRTLAVCGDGGLGAGVRSVLLSALPQLVHASLHMMPDTRGVLRGSMTLTSLTLDNVAAPTFCGPLPALTQLRLHRCGRAHLPSSMTATNLPALQSLHLHLVEHDSTKLLTGYAFNGTAPPRVRSLALGGASSSTMFLCELVASGSVEQLHLSLGIASVPAILLHLPQGVDTLSLDVGSCDRRDDVHDNQAFDHLSEHTFDGLATLHLMRIKHIDQYGPWYEELEAFLLSHRTSTVDPLRIIRHNDGAKMDKWDLAALDSGGR